MEKARTFCGMKFYQLKKGYWLKMFHTEEKSYGIYAHRYVWELHHGKIPPGAVIHHIDGDRSNNSIENLQLIPSQREHLKLHYSDPVVLEKQRRQVLTLNKFKNSKKQASKAQP